MIGPRVRPRNRLNPPLHRLRRIRRRRVETNPRPRRPRMDHVDQLLEQQQLLRHPQPRTDHHAVTAPRIETPRSDGFRRVPQIDQATVDLVAQPAQAIELLVDESPNELRRELLETG